MPQTDIDSGAAKIFSQDYSVWGPPMVQVDNSDIKALVHSLRAESVAYFRQWVVWLGVASGAGGMGLFSIAANLPDRNHAFHIFLPSLWVFLVGVAAAGLSVLFESISISWRGEHFAAAHNRQELNQAISEMPEMFSSPKKLAEEANSGRNKLIEESKKAHGAAERGWILHRRWRLARNVAVSVSAISFVCGMSWPIGFMTFGGKLTP
ncbi:hypothetical protein ACF1BQ_036960 [Bradyrhizobium sp. RDT10]